MSDPVTDAVADLVAVMDHLRSPGGCPWDAEQTHESLARYAVEEVHELLEAIDTGDRAGLREELGDVLLQVVFHARLAQEHPDEPFDLGDVAAGVAAKLRRRHPHVFGDADVRDAVHVAERWTRLKAQEKGRTSALEGVPVALPALARAQALLGRVRAAGLDVPLPVPPGGEGAGHPEGADQDAEAVVGAELFALVARAEAAGVDAESALRRAVTAWAGRVRAAEGSGERPAG